MKRKSLIILSGLVIALTVTSCTFPGIMPLDGPGMVYEYKEDKDNKGSEAEINATANQKEKEAEEVFTVIDEDSLRRLLVGKWELITREEKQANASLTLNQDGSGAFNYEEGTQEINISYSFSRYYNGEDEIPDVINIYSEADIPDMGISRGTSVGDFVIDDCALVDGQPVISLYQINNGDSLFSYFCGDYGPALHKVNSEKLTGEKLKQLKNEFFVARCFRAASKEDGDYVWVTEYDQVSDFFGNGPLYETNKYKLSKDCDYRVGLRGVQGYFIELTTNEDGEVTIINWYCGGEDDYYYEDENYEENEED